MTTIKINKAAAASIMRYSDTMTGLFRAAKVVANAELKDGWYVWIEDGVKYGIAANRVKVVQV